MAIHRAKYRSKWQKYHAQYERYSYKELQQTFHKWGAAMPWDAMTESNYKSLMASTVNPQEMFETYIRIYSHVGVVHGKRIAKTIDAQIKEIILSELSQRYLAELVSYLQKWGMTRIISVSKTYWEEIALIMQTKLAEGLTIREAAKEIEILINKRDFYRWQAMRIARTESTAAANHSAIETGNISGYAMDKEWISDLGPRTRRTPPDKFDHYHMNGVRVPAWQKFNVSGEQMSYPGDQSAQARNVINCYLPGNFIESNIISGQKSFYTGKAFEIITRRGERLSVTANHKILTKNGFIKAKDLKIGDNLICNTSSKYRFIRLIKNYINKKFFSVENVFSSTKKLWTSEKLMVTALDFDGDGKSINGDVDIVNPKIDLRHSVVSKIYKFLNNIKFSTSDSKSVFVSGFSSLNLFSGRNNTTSASVVSFLHLSFPLCFRHFRPLRSLRLGLGSKPNTIRFKVASNTVSRDSEFLRELIDTDSRIIAFDDVVDVRDFDFSGHVYDFSSVNGVNIVNNIYTSNCRCAVAMIPARDKNGSLIPLN